MATGSSGASATIAELTAIASCGPVTEGESGRMLPRPFPGCTVLLARRFEADVDGEHVPRFAASSNEMLWTMATPLVRARADLVDRPGYQPRATADCPLAAGNRHHPQVRG
jgi:hypothetical protein